jgi:hypothetical protein
MLCIDSHVPQPAIMASWASMPLVLRSNGCAAKLARLATSSVWLMLLLTSLLLAKLSRMMLLLLATSANGLDRLALHCCRGSPRPDTMLPVCEAS